MMITSYMARLLSWLMRLATPAQPVASVAAPSAMNSRRFISSSRTCAHDRRETPARSSARFALEVVSTGGIGDGRQRLFVLRPRHDPEPDGVHRRKEDEREHRSGEGAADQGVREGPPEHGVRKRDEGEDGRERGQDDRPRALNRRFHDCFERSDQMNTYPGLRRR